MFYSFREDSYKPRMAQGSLDIIVTERVGMESTRDVRSYSALSEEKSAQYDKVKKAILKAYELFPEAC